MIIARGKRLVPFRTQKLRLFAPMVLHFCGCGRVGHRRFIFEKDPVSKDAGSFVISIVLNRCRYLVKPMRCACCRVMLRGFRMRLQLSPMIGVCAVTKTHMVTRRE